MEEMVNPIPLYEAGYSSGVDYDALNVVTR